MIGRQCTTKDSLEEKARLAVPHCGSDAMVGKWIAGRLEAQSASLGAVDICAGPSEVVFRSGVVVAVD